MAMSCRIKKDLMRTKEDNIQTIAREKESATYAHVAQKTVEKMQDQIKTTQQPIIRIKQGTELRTLITVIHAHVHNLIVKGSYATELNRNLVLQGLPAMDNPPQDPPSGRLFGVEIMANIFSEEEKESLIAAQEQLRMQQELAIQNAEFIQKQKEKLN